MSEENTPKQLREILRVLERTLGMLEDNEFSCCEITLAQCHALVEIGRARSISLTALSELINLESSTMSRTVNNLVTCGLAKRDIDCQDRRYITISLTDSGQQLFERIEESMDHYYERIYAEIPGEKRGLVFESLSILQDAVAKCSCSKA